MKNFGAFILKIRKEKGLTLRKLGELAGISPSYLSEIENGSKLPPKEGGKLENLACVLGVNLQELKSRSFIDRETKGKSSIFTRIFGQDDELAVSLYRQTEDSSKEELEELKGYLEQAIHSWKESKSNNGK